MTMTDRIALLRYAAALEQHMAEVSMALENTGAIVSVLHGHALCRARFAQFAAHLHPDDLSSQPAP